MAIVIVVRFEFSRRSSISHKLVAIYLVDQQLVVSLGGWQLLGWAWRDEPATRVKLFDASSGLETLVDHFRSQPRIGRVNGLSKRDMNMSVWIGLALLLCIVGKSDGGKETLFRAIFVLE